MTDNVNHPKHYEAGPSVTIECIDVARHLPFARGNAFKYVWRCGKKGGPEQAIEDLEKALWYLDDSYHHSEEFDGHNLLAETVFNLIRPEQYVGFEELRLNALMDICHGADADDSVWAMMRYLKSKHLEGQE